MQKNVEHLRKSIHVANYGVDTDGGRLLLSYYNDFDYRLVIMMIDSDDT